MADESESGANSNMTAKAVAAVFVTVLAPVLVAFGMKLVDKVDAVIPSGKPAEKPPATPSEEKPAAAAQPSLVNTGSNAATGSADSRGGLYQETPLKFEWTFFQTEVGPLDTKRFEFRPDGSIALSAAGPKGVLLRPTNYEDFELSFDWRYAPNTKSGSWPGGVVFRTGLENWPDNRLSAVFAIKQIGKLHMGKNITLDTTEYNEVVTAKPGEWHTMQITCQGGDITVRHDQAVVSKATNCSRKSGRVGIAVDARDIEFRDFKVDRLAAADTKPAETKKSADTKKSGNAGTKKKRADKSSRN